MAEIEEKVWKLFLRRHGKAFALFIGAAVIAIIGAILVFHWFVGDAQATGLVPMTLNLWTMGYIITFLLNLILWEVLYIGIPVIIIVVAIYFLWWKKLPDDERLEYRHGHLFGKRSRKTDGGGAISFLINIFFIFKVYIDGNWNEPFADWTFDYLINSYLTAFLWVAIIFGIPITLGGIWWLRHELTKES
jgi:drug/metabolite transporter superfamily protein YnfA